jgi:hypothetical protein
MNGVAGSCCTARGLPRTLSHSTLLCESDFSRRLPPSKNYMAGRDEQPAKCDLLQSIALNAASLIHSTVAMTILS